jgi:multidrug efflux system membrane fusion protein
MMARESYIGLKAFTSDRHRRYQPPHRLHVRDEPDALLVPQIALGSSQLGKYVYVVGPDSKAEQKIVTLGPTEGDSVSVTGLAENDRVITGNLQKIGPGSPVSPIAQKEASASDVK